MGHSNIKKSKPKETETDWALTLKQEYIHIDEAESGRKGYFCLGCGKEMEGVIQKKDPTRQSYFRHSTHDVKRNLEKCVVANRNYRERIAEQILHRLKKIKVPAVIKYPPKGKEGPPILLQKLREIVASKVKSQLSFYEDENGEIQWGKNPELKDRYLLIRPDVTFFDAANNPILFVEFVITHKLDIEKKTKLQRLAIDTVQVIIPKKSEQEIEKTLTSSRAIKWVYNYEEANTEYVPPAEESSGGIYELDEDQRKLFEESFKCRSVQIGNLIRSINRCYRSEPYRRIERNFEQEISRIEKAKEGIESELATMEGELKAGITAEIQDFFKYEETEVGNGEKKLQKYRSKVEERYRELEERLGTKRRHLAKNIKQESGVSNPFEEFPRRAKSISGNYQREQRNFYQERKDIEGIEQLLNECRNEQEGVDFQLGEFIRIKDRIQRAAGKDFE